MSKIIQSPTEKWPGEIELHDPLTLPMIAAWEEALWDYDRTKPPAAIDRQLLPGVLACVKAWRLGNGFPEHPTLETFPAKPHAARRLLVAALTDAIGHLYQDDAEIPNDSGPLATDMPVDAAPFPMS